jgi:hypothetical protein
MESLRAKSASGTNLPWARRSVISRVLGRNHELILGRRPPKSPAPGQPVAGPSLAVAALVQGHIRQNWRVLLLNGLELIRIQTESLQDGGGDLHRLDRGCNRRGLEARI